MLDILLVAMMAASAAPGDLAVERVLMSKALPVLATTAVPPPPPAVVVNGGCNVSAIEAKKIAIIELSTSNVDCAVMAAHSYPHVYILARGADVAAQLAPGKILAVGPRMSAERVEADIEGMVKVVRQKIDDDPMHVPHKRIATFVHPAEAVAAAAKRYGWRVL
ncbi:MAG: hypothetical protein Q8O25_08340 [Sulfurisoma sp.]|nr:hypothetical protein [Sulfurisoma sp.]